jgi:hypothetical protein
MIIETRLPKRVLADQPARDESNEARLALMKCYIGGSVFCVAVEWTCWWYRMGCLKRVLPPMSGGHGGGALHAGEAIDANNLVGCALRMQQGRQTKETFGGSIGLHLCNALIGLHLCNAMQAGQKRCQR